MQTCTSDSHCGCAFAFAGLLQQALTFVQQRAQPTLTVLAASAIL